MTASRFITNETTASRSITNEMTASRFIESIINFAGTSNETCRNRHSTAGALWTNGNAPGSTAPAGPMRDCPEPGS
eukprot:3523795-Pyramimonas_sp.AAC.1